MAKWKYGDLMRYSPDQDPTDPPDWLFMFVNQISHTFATFPVQEYLNVVVVRVPDDDDMWETGTTLVAGINEMVPYVE